MSQKTLLCVEFEALDRDDQLLRLQNDGVYIGKRKLKQGPCLLYQYHTIYVEIRYKVHRMDILSIHCFPGTDILDLY